MDLFYCYINEFETKNKYAIQHNAGIKLTKYAAKIFYNIEDTEIEIINNKPRFKYSKKQFNISHSNDIAVVCFDDNPIGIDVEYIKQRDINELSKRMGFKLKDKTLEEFYTLWTQYEAKYKLGFDAICIKSQLFLDEFMLSIASTSYFSDINIKEIKI